MRRSRAPSFEKRQAYYRCIEAEIARDAMDREVERRRKAGLVKGVPPVSAPPGPRSEPADAPRTADALIEALARVMPDVVKKHDVPAAAS